MDNKFQKTLIVILMVCGLIFTAIGSTFAWLSVGNVRNNTTIKGSTYNFSVNLDVSTIRSGDLIPVVDNLVVSSLNSTHVCEDTRGYGLCSLYRIRFTNNGSAQTMTGYLKTISSTYTTTNLKYRLFSLSGSTYSAISDIASVNNTANATNNFQLSSANVTVSLADGASSSTTTDVYLVIWVSDPGSNQLADQNKSYSGQLLFSSTSGDTLTSTFISA